MFIGNSNQKVLQNGLQFDTIVIGGGIGGVSAAVKLSKAGHKVAIFEANSYLGGRLKTTPLNLNSGGTLQFDEGASWIHGSNKNHPITKLSKNIKGLISVETNDDSAEIYDEQGKNVTKKTDKAFQLYQNLLQKCEKKPPQQSMQKSFQDFKQNITKDKYFMFNVSNDVQFQTSGGISNLAANTLDDDQFKGKQMLILSGYQRFVDSLASQASFQFYLNQKVIKVIWQNGVNSVICANGITVSSKFVILAVPIGVLKTKQIEFYPSLPNWKIEAIQSIGFGNVCKIAIQFFDGSMIEQKTHYIGVVDDDVRKRGLATYFLNLKKLANIPVLMTFGLGDNADEAQKMAQTDLKALLAKRLSAFTRQQVTPNSFRIYRTSWRTNRNFLGSYSYSATTTRQRHWQNMSKPIFSSHWYFCGEHTTSKYRGTVHGAYLSGISAAKWIQSNITQHNWIYPDFTSDKKRSSSSSSSSSSN